LEAQLNKGTYQHRIISNINNNYPISAEIRSGFDILFEINHTSQLQEKKHMIFLKEIIISMILKCK